MVPAKVGLYTAVYGNYDDPRSAPILPVPCRLFTDEPGDFDVDLGWDVWGIGPKVEDSEGKIHEPTNMLRHKFWKTHPAAAFPDAEISIWVDGSIEITDPDFVDKALDYLGDADWMTMKHPWRDCVYDEAVFSAQLSRYDGVRLTQQADFYRDVIGHPVHWGLPATGILVRRHTEAVVEMGEQWWDECLHWTHQDQVSLPVLARLNEEKVKTIFTLPWGEGWTYHEHSPRGFQ